MADEFGVQVAGMIGRLQWEAEVVHGEDVFEEFGFLEVADAAGRSRGIEAMSEGIGADVKVVVVARFVDTHAPENDAGMIPVAANHAVDVVDGDELPSFVTNVLPSGDFFEDEQAHFVAGIEEMAGLRVVGSSHDVAMELLT